jgi:ammonium transporter, Amt family
MSEILVTLFLSTVATAVIALVLRMLIGLRPSSEIETAGLDLSEHGEEAYID